MKVVNFFRKPLSFFIKTMRENQKRVSQFRFCWSSFVVLCAIVNLKIFKLKINFDQLIV